MVSLDTVQRKKIYLAGHSGMVGRATLTELTVNGYTNILTTPPDFDLRRQDLVNRYFEIHRPESVIVAAARVGGILANSRYPYDFIIDNLLIEANLINAAVKFNVPDLIFLGSSCIYPQKASQPIKEESLLTGSLEPTNEWYAIAKIGGIKLCQAANRQFGLNYLSLMPTNLYGEGDNFDLQTSHVLPAMLRKFHDAKPDGSVQLWGTGSPMREFMHVRDLAKAIRFVLEHECPEDIYNVGTGEDISIRDLAKMIQMTVGHEGPIVWDSGKPDGTPRKLLDVSRLHSMGWKHTIELEDGIAATYKWMINNTKTLREVKHGS
ncbi:MAG: GDP-L-fucose synthase [Candidatus Cloacimonadaceae bacterium]|nr:GDP-L-fucose synthase [Candidatus Cloacimonadaceae bacterium]